MVLFNSSLPTAVMAYVDSWDKMKEVYGLTDEDEIAFILIADNDTQVVSLIMIVQKADGTMGIMQGEAPNENIGPVITWTWEIGSSYAATVTSMSAISLAMVTVSV